MATQALNTFRTITATVTTVPTTIYTAPIGYSSIVLGTQVANVSNGDAIITAWHVRGITATELVKDFEIPRGDAMGILSGKLVLQQGDGLRVLAAVDNTLKITLSILESSND
jgi:hypothetical protein